MGIFNLKLKLNKLIVLSFLFGTLAIQGYGQTYTIGEGDDKQTITTVYNSPFALPEWRIGVMPLNINSAPYGSLEYIIDAEYRPSNDISFTVEFGKPVFRALDVNRQYLDFGLQDLGKTKTDFSIIGSHRISESTTINSEVPYVNSFGESPFYANFPIKYGKSWEIELGYSFNRFYNYTNLKGFTFIDTSLLIASSLVSGTTANHSAVIGITRSFSRSYYFTSNSGKHATRFFQRKYYLRLLLPRLQVLDPMGVNMEGIYERAEGMDAKAAFHDVTLPLGFTFGYKRIKSIFNHDRFHGFYGMEFGYFPTQYASGDIYYHFKFYFGFGFGGPAQTN